MIWWPGLIAAASLPASPAHLTCALSEGVRHSTLSVTLDEQKHQASILLSPGKTVAGSVTFGPRYISLTHQIGRESLMTTINRSDLSARQTGTFFSEILYGVCRSEEHA